MVKIIVAFFYGSNTIRVKYVLNALTVLRTGYNAVWRGIYECIEHWPLQTVL